MMNRQPLPRLDDADVVCVIDDDEDVRKALQRLLRSIGLAVETSPSPQAFLASPLADRPSCLVLGVQLPGQSGLDLQTALEEAELNIPIVFVTGHGDVPTSVRAMKAGAVEGPSGPDHGENARQLGGGPGPDDRENRHQAAAKVGKGPWRRRAQPA